MTGGNKIDDFLTARKKIYEKQEKKSMVYCQSGKKSITSRKKINAMPQCFE